MNGARAVVVGASAGIGHAVARAAVDAGARVVAAARRAEPLAEIPGAHAVAADVTIDAGRGAIVAAARDHLGGVDLLLYAAGRADLRRVADVPATEWQATFATNVVAFNRLVAGALPLLATGAIVAALSSETADIPRAGLVPYAASKAALNAAARGWQVEHPQVRFSTVAIGPTQPTEFGDAFDGELLGPLMQEWDRKGLLPAQYMATTEVAALLVALYGAALANPSVGVEHVVLRP